MKRDSKHFGNYREKLFGAKLYGRNVEPVLELCTDDNLSEAAPGAPVKAPEYR